MSRSGDVGVSEQWFAQKVLQVERVRVHGEVALGVARPLVLRAVPIKFDAVVVGIAEVEGLADTVVGGAFEGNVVRDEPAERIGECGAGGVEDREVIEAGGARGRGLAVLAFPRVEAKAAERKAALRPMRWVSAKPRIP